MDNKLGKLERVALREAWPHEAADFTPWLAQDDNIALLSEALGMELAVDAQEKDVGPFRADILAKDVQSDRFVLIENQLDKTDHGHLGQLLTYAAGLQATTLVWIARDFTEEHRAALDWLNAHTEEEVQFFGVEVQLWRIGQSAKAPRFAVVSKPNDWSRSVSLAARKVGLEDLSETKQLQLEYWTAFRDYVLTHSSIIRPQKPYAQHWADYHLGHSDYHLSAFVNTRDKRIGVLLNVKGPFAKEHFHQLLHDKDAIEAEIPGPITWRELPDQKWSTVTTNHPTDPADRVTWPSQHARLCELLEAYYRAFRSRVRQLDDAAVSIDMDEEARTDGQA